MTTTMVIVIVTTGTVTTATTVETTATTVEKAPDKRNESILNFVLHKVQVSPEVRKALDK
jgi:hypothetical protein